MRAYDIGIQLRRWRFIEKRDDGAIRDLGYHAFFGPGNRVQFFEKTADVASGVNSQTGYVWPQLKLPLCL
jgi:hypothetical protein